MAPFHNRRVQPSKADDKQEIPIALAAHGLRTSFPRLSFALQDAALSSSRVS